MDRSVKEASARYDFERARNHAMTQELLAPLTKMPDVSDVDDGFIVNDFADQYSECPIIGQLKTVHRTILRLFGRKRPPVEMVST